jgi:hypothetical protein
MWIYQWISIISGGLKSTPYTEWNNDCWIALIDECYSYCSSSNNHNTIQLNHEKTIVRAQVFRDTLFITSLQQLFHSFELLLSRILTALESGAVSLRAKALKAVSLIVAGDCMVLVQQNVCKTIALRIQDQSSSVRDAATDLVGKYMLQDESVRNMYYEIVSDRISVSQIYILLSCIVERLKIIS